MGAAPRYSYVLKKNKPTHVPLRRARDLPRVSRAYVDLPSLPAYLLPPLYPLTTTLYHILPIGWAGIWRKHKPNTCVVDLWRRRFSLASQPAWAYSSNCQTGRGKVAPGWDDWR